MADVPRSDVDANDLTILFGILATVLAVVSICLAYLQVRRRPVHNLETFELIQTQYVTSECAYDADKIRTMRRRVVERSRADRIRELA